MTDLHMHSTASDGQYTPAQLMRLALEAGVTTVALTDHDTIDGLEEASRTAFSLGLSFLPGIEISAKGNRELHMLGYCIHPEAPALQRACAGFRHFRDIRKYKILDFLADQGVILQLDDVERLAGGQLIARPHFARAMVNAGYVATVREAFDLYLGTPAFDRVERPKPSPREAIAMIQKAGGVAVLAHPKQLRLSDGALASLVRDLTELGLCGIECYYSTHTPEETAFYLTLAKKYRLLVTGGSDFHGEAVKPEIRLGTGIRGSLCFDGSMIADMLRAAAVSNKID